MSICEFPDVHCRIFFLLDTVVSAESEHQLPFQESVPGRASIDDMKTVVALQGERPAIPPSWRENTVRTLALPVRWRLLNFHNELTLKTYIKLLARSNGKFF